MTDGDADTGATPVSQADERALEVDEPPAMDPTPSIGMSRRRLRAQLLQRAAILASRARAARRRGDIHHARLLQHRAEQAHNVARSMNED